LEVCLHSKSSTIYKTTNENAKVYRKKVVTLSTRGKNANGEERPSEEENLHKNSNF